MRYEKIEGSKGIKGSILLHDVKKNESDVARFLQKRSKSTNYCGEGSIIGEKRLLSEDFYDEPTVRFLNRKTVGKA